MRINEIKSNMDIKSLANKINDFFVSLTEHLPSLRLGTLPLSVPYEFLSMLARIIRQQMFFYTCCKLSIAVDSGEASARLLFTDFTKGFDVVDHTICKSWPNKKFILCSSDGSRLS